VVDVRERNFTVIPAIFSSEAGTTVTDNVARVPMTTDPPLATRTVEGWCPTQCRPSTATM